MKTETRVKIDTKIAEGVPLTLDERVYYYECKQLDKFRSGMEPILASVADVKALFSRQGRDVTDEIISDWLDKENVPK